VVFPRISHGSRPTLVNGQAAAPREYVSTRTVRTVFLEVCPAGGVLLIAVIIPPTASTFAELDPGFRDHATGLGCGCDMGQGYLFSRPLPADQLIAFIRQHNS